MGTGKTLLLQRGDVVKLLSMEDCMNAVERAFCLHAKGQALTPKLLGIHSKDGAFHIKAGIMGDEHPYFVAKVNANFPLNPSQFGLPTIQGVIVVCDAKNGELLALMDSIEITVIRTGAATGVAVKWLSLGDADTCTICGCGNQGRISIEAILQVRKLRKIFVYDMDHSKQNDLVALFKNRLEIVSVLKGELSNALRESQVVVTCTPSKKFFIRPEDISPGTLVAAVGADNEEKQELSPELLASNKVVTDLTEQCVKIGELHHAIVKGIMDTSFVYGELGAIIAGNMNGRESDDEIIIFDSTGTALQDVAAASIVFESAKKLGIGSSMDFSNQAKGDLVKKKKTKSKN